MRLVRAWRRTPLWLRLISATLCLVALGLMLTGAFGVRLLRGYLLDRVDEQLTDAVQELAQSEQVPRNGSSVPTQFDFTVFDAEGEPRWTVSSPLMPSRPDLPDLAPSDADDWANDPFTVDAAEGDGRWRVLAVPLQNGSGALAVATSLDEVDATVKRLVQIDVLVGLAVLAGLGIVGISMVRTALRPLEEIEVTAAAIGRGDLGRRVPDHHPGTEMGRLSRALNAMLEQVERAFGARTRSEAKARASEQRMRRFIADASHELRTPLTSIRGFAELHRQGAVTDPDAVSDLLRRIEDEAGRMGLLVDDLLLLARLDQQRPLELRPVDVGEVARAAVEGARAAAPDRQIRIDAPATPLVVAGDPARLHQVVTNLLDNALAYSPGDSPATVRASRVVIDGRPRVAVEVTDRGPGLTPDQQARVFERFYRTDAARSRARGGTGLGLSIVAAIIAAHGGTVEVESEPGEGSTFRVLLPADDTGGAGDGGSLDAGESSDAADPADAPAVGEPARSDGAPAG